MEKAALLQATLDPKCSTTSSSSTSPNVKLGGDDDVSEWHRLGEAMSCFKYVGDDEEEEEVGGCHGRDNPGLGPGGHGSFHRKVRATYLRRPPCWKWTRSTSLSSSAVTLKDFPVLVWNEKVGGTQVKPSCTTVD